MRTPTRGLGAASAILVALAAGCGSSTAPPPAAPAGQVVLSFDHEVDGQPLVLHTMRYTNAAGDNYNVNELKYYVSDVQLVAADNSVVAGPATTYRDAEVASTEKATMASVPAGDYVALRFTFGVAAARNVTGGLPASVENNRMEWPDVLGGGYHYMQLDGAFASATGDVGWMAHLGRLHRTNDPAPVDPSFEVELPLTLHVQRESHDVQVVMNVNEWFRSPTVYDFAVIGPNNMSNPDALRALQANGHDVFRIGTTTLAP